jgi:retron-type reverse transcriptase
METWTNTYPKLCSYENLELAYRKARKGKTYKNYVINFEANLDTNLKQLEYELENLTYSPAPLKTFIIKDPKTRKVSASHFRDRVIHHALCNIIGPILEKEFIHDSFANQKGKGTHGAVLRFEKFMRKMHTDCKSGRSRRGGGAA